MRNSKAWYFVALACLIGYVVITMMDLHHYAGWLLMAFFVCIALGFRGHELLRGYSYTIMIFAAVSLSMYYPQYFIQVGDFKLSKLIVPLLQIIMFGMGAALSWKDFAGIRSMTKGVILGLVFQYSIMPFLGWAIANTIGLPPEIAAGFILIGSCPSGLASNVMSYLARANLALSVTLTALATLLAPLFTPMYMNLLAGELVEVNFWAMVWDITKIIIIPVGAGVLFNYFLHGKFKWLDNVMPLISMIGIALIIVVITAAGRESLLTVGPLLILGTFIHNTFGYIMGYWSARFSGMPERDCRTIALEVGLQNGGLASGLALSMGKLATVGLVPAVFGPLMNITGSSLALWWRSKPPEEVVNEKVETV